MTSLVWKSAGASAGQNPSPDRPFIGKGADGQLEVFKIDDQGRLFHRWRKTTTGEWSLWSNLGGSLFPGIAVANNASGLMEVFGVDQKTREVRYIRQLTTNSYDWSDWKSLGGTFEPPVAAAQDAEGQVEVFAVDATTRSVKHLWQTNGPRSGWTDLGGTVDPRMVVARNKDGRLELFGIQAHGELAHCWQLEPSAKSAWSPWASLGGNIAPGFGAGQNQVGRLEVFAVNQTNAAMNRICQGVPGESARWSAWTNFGGDVEPGMSVGQGGGGRLEIFAVNAADSTLLHRWELFPNDSDKWSPWEGMGQAAQPYFAVSTNEDGNLEVFAADPVNGSVIHHRRQISYASDWLDWATLDQPVFEYASRTWQVDEGLPDNLVQAITQTPDGYLWVGTREGLARFDGVKFTSFEARNTPAIKNSSITALYSGADGTLWIGTDGGGLLSLKDGEFKRFSKTDGLAGNNVRVIYQTRDGALWIGTTSGLNRFKSGKFTTYSGKQKLLSDNVRRLCEDRNGNLWIATVKGLNRLRRDGTLDTFAMPNGLPNDIVRGICQDKGGRIWIGSNNGLLWFNWFWGNSFYAYNTKYGLADTFVSAICEANDGNLWVGTYGGLNRFRDGRFYNQYNNEGLPFDRINALFEDREGNLWVGSKEGLIRLTPKRFFTYTRQQGLTHNNVMSVIQGQGGDLWIGTWGGGLNRLRDDKITSYATSHPATNGLSQDLILSLCEGRDGSVWIGADFDGGLARLKDGKMTRYPAEFGLTNAGLRVMHEDAVGNLWIGASRGLCCFKDGGFRTNALTAKLADETIRDICEDHAGALWFATQNGLYRWDKGQLSHLGRETGLSDDTIIALYEDPDNTLWIGTGGGGLDRLRDGRVTAYSTRQGLFSDEIFAILEDDEGCLWMSCSQGIFRVVKKEFADLDEGRIQAVSSLVFGRSDGMESPQCNGAAKPAAWKTRDGRLWFPTSKGLAMVNPATIFKDNFPPPVYIEAVLAERKDMLQGRSDAADAQPWLFGHYPTFKTPPAVLRIPPGRHDLEFHYTALNLAAPEKSHFKYKLSGVDPEWVDAGTRRVTSYNNLLPGSYEFEVKACNKDGLWSDGVRLAVELRPYYWETMWFRGLMIAVLVCGASGVVLYGTRRRMQRKLALLEQQQAVERERVRIARDMHDQLGAGLTQIGLLGEFARRDARKSNGVGGHAEKICDAARELAQTLDEIVWMVNPRNDTLQKLGVYLAAYAEEFFQAAAIRCRLDIPPVLPEFPLSAELRHNLFLVVKEALNNVVKHSRATEVWVKLSLHHGELDIIIEDNGTGFSAEATDDSRCGLSNMETRMREIGGAFKIASRPETGTRIRLRVPIKGARFIHKHAVTN
jgi:ligand-binding sensor domain-containing protein/signal transduction histidine kinase